MGLSFITGCRVAAMAGYATGMGAGNMFDPLMAGDTALPVSGSGTASAKPK